ncbi:hypothetical protein J1TS5_03420 [Paenibacillus macerans]|uniref:type II toxin-antitoxin system PemK/MazF family toxin n=1 Tax=Paenibacillus macerans TaxID=44252 RepID=UPI001B18CA4B|nr:type II toxin-antitoxin system PemK/MazF family toxin [Paenibacillus macerans]GIP08172.1 hypothetical protein J1TS5_03420 [Paenibacillus macerans]
MTNSIRTYKRGDIWIADVLYRDDTSQSKKRPVVVLSMNNLDEDILIAPVTSSDVRNEWDITLNLWNEEGLVFPSNVRTSKLSSIYQGRLKRRIGNLKDEDLQAVLVACRSLFD